MCQEDESYSQQTLYEFKDYEGVVYTTRDGYCYSPGYRTMGEIRMILDATDDQTVRDQVMCCISNGLLHKTR
jgi:hypothetical protein